jgi:hypothetical protein
VVHQPAPIAKPIHPRGNLLTPVSPYKSSLAVSALLSWVYANRLGADGTGLPSHPLQHWLDGAWPWRPGTERLAGAVSWTGKFGRHACALVLFRDRTAVVFGGDRADHTTALYTPLLLGFKLPPAYTCPVVVHRGAVVGQPLEGPRVPLGSGHLAVEKAAAALEQSAYAWLDGRPAVRWVWDQPFGPDCGVDERGAWQVPLCLPTTGFDLSGAMPLQMWCADLVRTMWQEAPVLHGNVSRLSLWSGWRDPKGKLRPLRFAMEHKTIRAITVFEERVQEQITAVLALPPSPELPIPTSIHGRCVRLLDTTARGEAAPRAVLMPLPIWSWAPEAPAHRNLLGFATPALWPKSWEDLRTFP